MLRGGWSMGPSRHEHGLFGWVVAGTRLSHRAQVGSEYGYWTVPSAGTARGWVLGQGTKASPWLPWPHRWPVLLFYSTLFQKRSVWRSEKESRGSWWVWWWQSHRTHRQTIQVRAVVQSYCGVGRASSSLCPGHGTGAKKKKVFRLEGMYNTKLTPGRLQFRSYRLYLSPQLVLQQRSSLCATASPSGYKAEGIGVRKIFCLYTYPPISLWGLLKGQGTVSFFCFNAMLRTTL